MSVGFPTTCVFCGQYHPYSPVCPTPNLPEPQEAWETTLNGLTPGEQAIMDKLNEILKELRNAK